MPSATSGQVFLLPRISKQAEPIVRSKPVDRTPPWSLLQLLTQLPPLVEFMPWLPSVTGCDWMHKPDRLIPPQAAFSLGSVTQQ